MLSGVKFVSLDSLDNARGEDKDGGDSMTKRKKSHSKRDKHRTRKRSSHRGGSSSSSSDDDDLQRIEKRSHRGKKWYSSDEYSSSEEGSTDSRSDRKKKKTRKSNNNMDDGGHELKHKSKGRRNHQRHPKQEYSSPSPSASEDADVSAEGKHSAGKGNAEVIDIARKEMGLEWMLRPAETTDKNPAVIVPELPEEPPADETPKLNPRELNPYLKNNGTGYPVDAEEKTANQNRLASSPVVGDGGASWRLKALKRAKEQAAREGRKLEEVVGERWGSVGQLAVSASYSAAPARAHLHEIKNRKRSVTQGSETSLDGENKKNFNQSARQSYSKDVSVQRPGMRAPKVHDSLSWGRRNSKSLSAPDDSIIAAAASSLNKFSDDGSFMSGFVNRQNVSSGEAAGSSGDHGKISDSKVIPCTENVISDASTPVEQQMSANQLAAKALQLRLKGKHEEAEKLMGPSTWLLRDRIKILQEKLDQIPLQEAANAKAKQTAEKTSSREHMVGRSRQVIQNVSTRKMEDDADKNLAQTIIQNRKYSSASQADDEYDYELAPSKKSLKKSAASGHKPSVRGSNPQRFLTQPERCNFCFENPNRPKHLVVSIANFTYLMVPQRQSVVPGHCCILPLQHESATRSVDNNVWQEIRNFKKCLIMMFAQQEKEVVFLETVVDLAKQRRHCLVECIPLPREIAKEAPLYFKKAIDEAEDEWSQHNAKKLIDTSEKGLRGSIPKDFPYFHVEFGLNKGFVHVIDDETQFNSSLGLNVIRGMLRLPEEDMYRSRRRESVETQKQAATDFLRNWEPFDWTKQLD